MTADIDFRSSERAPGAKFAEVLTLLPNFIETVRALTGDVAHSADFSRISALIAAFEPILKVGAASAHADDLEFSADQIAALLYMLDESIPGAARKAPLFPECSRGIDQIYRLISGYRSPAESVIPAPAASRQAHEGQGNTEVADPLRARLAIRACFELDGLAKMAHDHLVQEDPDDDFLPVRSMLRRVRRLASVQLSALGDSLEDVDSIMARFEESDDLQAT